MQSGRLCRSDQVRNIAVSEDGDSAKVRFKTDDWRVYSVCVNDKTYWSPDFSSKPPETVDGKTKLTATGFTMYYKKSSERELTMFFQPNFSDSDLKVEVVIASSFEYDTLTVTQPRSSGYELERIEWNEPVAMCRHLHFCSKKVGGPCLTKMKVPTHCASK